MGPATAVTVAMVLAASGCRAAPAPSGRAASVSIRTDSAGPTAPAPTTSLPGSSTPTAAPPVASAYGDAVSSKAAATKRAISLVQAITLPQHATALAHSPSAALSGYGTPDFSGPTLVQVARWWSVPGELSAVLAEIVTHPPKGFSLCSGACPNNGPTIVDLSFWPQNDSSAQTSVAVTLQRGVGHVNVRVVGRSIWDPEPTAQERVPPTARSVFLSWRLSGSGSRDTAIKPRNGTFSGPEAAHLARLLNQMRTEQPLPAPAGCFDGNVKVTARFRFGRHNLLFSWTNGNCALTTATYDGVAQPVLIGNTATPLVKRLLHA